MGFNQRDIEIEAIDKRIADIESDKLEIHKYAKAAKSIVALESTDDYKIAIEQTFLEDEAKRLTDRLTCDDYVQKNELEVIDESLRTLRGFKAFISSVKRLGESAKDKLTACDARIAEEMVYREVVMLCKDDLSDLSDRLGA